MGKYKIDDLQDMTPETRLVKVGVMIANELHDILDELKKRN